MNQPNVLFALVAKRGEISGHIVDLEKRVKHLRASLAHVDAAIKLFSPGTDPTAIPPKRIYRKAQLCPAKELSRLTLSALRESGRAMTTDELATTIIASQGLNADDPNLRGQILTRLFTVLYRYGKQGAVRKTGVGRAASWRLKD